MKEIKNIVIFGAVCCTLLASSCSGEKPCDFTDINKAVDCSCEIATQKKEAVGDQDKLDKLKAKTKSMDDAFEKALENNTYTKEEFSILLKEKCESFGEK